MESSKICKFFCYIHIYFRKNYSPIPLGHLVYKTCTQCIGSINFRLNIHIIYISIHIIVHTYAQHIHYIQPSVYVVYTSAMFGKLNGRIVHLRKYSFIYSIAIHIIMGCDIPRKVPSEFIRIAVWCLAGWVFLWFRWWRNGSHKGLDMIRKWTLGLFSIPKASLSGESCPKPYERPINPPTIDVGSNNLHTPGIKHLECGQYNMGAQHG